MRGLLIAIVICANITFAFAQSNEVNGDDSTFTVETIVSGAVMATQYDVAPTAQSVDDRFVGSAFIGRLLWRPNHLLAIGLQTGYVTFSTEDLQAQSIPGASELRVSLTAIPIQLAISMNPGSFDLGVGLGGYLLQSIWRIDDDQRVNSSAIEFGVNSWIGYEFDVFDRLSVGPELSLHVMSNRGIASLAVGVRIRYDVIRY